MTSDPGLAPDEPLPGEDSPAPSGPELDPAGAPEEMPEPDLPGDDGTGRPIDGSMTAS